ncbi:unnamed protein product [Ectocarpus sp. 13 AM-2016]
MHDRYCCRCTTSTSSFVDTRRRRPHRRNFCKPPPRGKCFMHARAPSTRFRRKNIRRAISLVHKTNHVHRKPIQIVSKEYRSFAQTHLATNTHLVVYVSNTPFTHPTSARRL